LLSRNKAMIKLIIIRNLIPVYKIKFIPTYMIKYVTPLQNNLAILTKPI